MTWYVCEGCGVSVCVCGGGGGGWVINFFDTLLGEGVKKSGETWLWWVS